MSTVVRVHVKMTCMLCANAQVATCFYCTLARPQQLVFTAHWRGQRSLQIPQQLTFSWIAQSYVVQVVNMFIFKSLIESYINQLTYLDPYTTRGDKLHLKSTTNQVSRHRPTTSAAQNLCCYTALLRCLLRSCHLQRVMLV